MKSKQNVLRYVVQNGKYILKQQQASQTSSRPKSDIDALENSPKQILNQEQKTEQKTISNSKHLNKSMVSFTNLKSSEENLNQPVEYLPKYFTSRKANFSKQQNSTLKSDHSTPNLKIKQYQEIQIRMEEEPTERKIASNKETERKIKELNSEMIEKENQINHLKQREALLMKQKINLENKNLSLMNINKQLSGNLQMFVKGNPSQSKKFIEEDQVVNLKLRIQQAQRYIQEISQKNQNFYLENRKFSEVIKYLEGMNLKLSNQNKDLRSRLLESSRRKQNYSEEIIKEKQNYKSLIQNLQKQIERMTEVITNLQGQNLKKEVQLQSSYCAEELLELKQEIQKQKEIIEIYRKKMDKKTQGLKSNPQNENDKQELLKVKSELNEKNRELSEVHENLYNLEMEYRNCESEFRMYEMRSKNQMDKLKNHYQMQIEELKITVDKNRNVQENLNLKIKRINEEIIQKDKLIKKLITQKQAKNNQKDLSSEFNSLKQKIQSLTFKLEEKDRYLKQNLSDKIKQLASQWQSKYNSINTKFETKEVGINKIQQKICDLNQLLNQKQKYIIKLEKQLQILTQQAIQNSDLNQNKCKSLEQNIEKLQILLKQAQSRLQDQTTLSKVKQCQISSLREIQKVEKQTSENKKLIKQNDNQSLRPKQTAKIWQSTIHKIKQPQTLGFVILIQFFLLMSNFVQVI